MVDARTRTRKRGGKKWSVDEGGGREEGSTHTHMHLWQKEENKENAENQQ
jgi:hypothetical protein